MSQIMPLSDEAIAKAALWIADGQPVAVPTETVYGLAADATNARAVAAIYAAKGRPQFNPLIVHVLDTATAARLADFSPLALQLAAAFWPGPLTMVLPRRADSPIAQLVTAGLDTIALRVPAHRAMRALLAATNVPLAAPSANASGHLSPTRALHVAQSLGHNVALILDDGPCAIGLESTIVAPRAHGALQLLRAGTITAEALRAACGVALVEGPAGIIEAPGQLAQHYAPRKPLRLNATTAASDEVLIGFGEVAGTAGYSLSRTAALDEAAALLFDRLHDAEQSGWARIAVAPIPDDGLGRAINDRLSRAALGPPVAPSIPQPVKQDEE